MSKKNLEIKESDKVDIANEAKTDEVKTDKIKINNKAYKTSEETSKSNKKTKPGKVKKLNFGNLKASIVDFSKLLWTCITYKFILLIIAALYIAYSFTGFKCDVQKQINKNTEVYLSSMVSESLERIRLKINDEYNVLKTLSLLYDENNEIDIDMTSNLLEKALNAHEFVGLSLVSADKDEVLTIGDAVNYDHEDFLNNILNGNNAVSTIIADEKNNVEYICLGVPVYKNEKIVGALICDYDIQEFTEIIDTSSFEKLGTTFISQEDGILVARPDAVGKNTNLFVLLDSINIKNEKSIAKLKKQIKNGRSGIITYGSGKHKRYICYDIVPDTNWYAVSIVSANTIEPVAKKVSSYAYSFAYTLSVVFIIYILITMTMDIKIAKKKKMSTE
ncbi:MAG: cache domain-containing protein [Lachnospiraceae bacterium]|nr:cache domain-containing protein [Lachnospiraceae bacterium]